MDSKEINVTQKLEEIRQIWISGMKVGNEEILYFFKQVYLEHSKARNNNIPIPPIISEEEYIDIFIQQCKNGEVWKINENNALSKILTNKGIYKAYHRMILECGKEFVEEYLRCYEVLHGNSYATIMFLALVETNWNNKSNIDKTMDYHSIDIVLGKVFEMKSKLALRYYIERKIGINKSAVTGPDFSEVTHYGTAFLMFVFSEGKFLYNPAIYLYLTLCKNSRYFISQLSQNIFNSTYIKYLFDFYKNPKHVSKNMSEQFIWFLIEIDFFKHFSRDTICKNIKEWNKIKSKNISLEVIEKKYTDNKKKLTNIIDNGYAPYIPKDIVGIIKRYMVFYEHML